MSDRAQKTYSVWGLLILFLILGALGLLGVLFLGASGNSATEQLPRNSSTTSTSTTRPPSTDTAIYEMPDGSPLPENLEKVMVSPGQRIYFFKIPDSFDSEPGVAVVAPGDADSAGAGAAVTVQMYCAVSQGSVPMQITVLEDDNQVRIVPVALGNVRGTPCEPDDVLVEITLPLEEPIGTRPLVMDPPGAVVERP